MTETKKKKRGRGRPPKPGGPDPSVLIKFPPALLEAIDAYAKRAGLNRSEAVRHLVEDALRRAARRKS
jgi:hypothetical protein